MAVAKLRPPQPTTSNQSRDSTSILLFFLPTTGTTPWFSIGLYGHFHFLEATLIVSSPLPPPFPHLFPLPEHQRRLHSSISHQSAVLVKGSSPPPSLAPPTTSCPFRELPPHAIAPLLPHWNTSISYIPASVCGAPGPLFGPAHHQPPYRDPRLPPPEQRAPPSASLLLSFLKVLPASCELHQPTKDSLGFPSAPHAGGFLRRGLRMTHLFFFHSLF